MNYCDFVLLNLPATQTRLQLALNSAARVVTKTPKLRHIMPTPILESLRTLAQNK